MNIKRICTMFFSILFVGGISFVNAMDDKKQEKPSICSICSQELKWEELNKGVLPSIVTPPCGHSFHRFCLKKYAEDSERCPICKEDMNTDDWLASSRLKSSMNLYNLFRFLPGLTLGNDE